MKKKWKRVYDIPFIKTIFNNVSPKRNCSDTSLNYFKVQLSTITNVEPTKTSNQLTVSKNSSTS